MDASTVDELLGPLVKIADLLEMQHEQARADRDAARERVLRHAFLQGKTVSLPALPAGVLAANAQAVPAVWAEDIFEEPEQCTLLAQLQGSAAPAGTSVTGTLRWVAGNAIYTMSFPLTPRIRKVRVVAKSVFFEVQSSMVSAANVSASLIRGSPDALGDTVPQWVPRAGIVTKLAAPIVGSGVLLGCQGHVDALVVDTKVWLQFFDKATAPTDGADSALVTIGPFVAGQIVSFDRSTRPDLEFYSGLTWALANQGTPLYHAANVGSTAGIDFDWGP